jgi:hypothetical protein
MLKLHFARASLDGTSDHRSWRVVWDRQRELVETADGRPRLGATVQTFTRSFGTNDQNARPGEVKTRAARAKYLVVKHIHTFTYSRRHSVGNGTTQIIQTDV